ncbi:MAG: glycosyltransferase family 39 protein [Candidatus Omnitrophica bacterium]|nr:glycosyltransferase family 39 protein [Candidatus Omnitrophota bacterium]
MYSRPPLYPIFVAFVYRLFGTGNLKAVYFVQALLGALTCNLVYEMTRRLFGSFTAFLAALLVLVNFPLVASSSRLLSECLFTVLLTGAFLLLQIDTRGTIACSGLLLGLSGMTKGIIFFLPFLLAGGFILRGRKEGISKGVILAGTFFLMLLPLVVRNHLVYHTFVPVSTQGGYVFYNSYHPLNGKIFGYHIQDETMSFANRIESETERSAYLVQRTFEDIRRNPLYTLRLEVLKFLYFWAPFDWEILGQGRYHFLYGFVFPFFLLGIFWAKERRFLLLTPILYFQGMALLFYGSPRFRLPIEPFMMMLGAFGLMEIFRRFSRPFGWVLTTAVITTNIGLASFLNPFKQLLATSLHHMGLW